MIQTTTTLALPGPVGRIATAVADAHQVPTDLAAVLALGVLSGATRGRWRLQVRPGWTESLALYAAALAEPGGRRSAVLGDLTAPLVERELVANASVAYAEAVADRKEAIAAGRQMDAVDEPHRVQLWFDDVTTESLPLLLARQGGASAHFGDGGILDAATFRHGTWGYQAGLDTLLKAHDGGRLRIDRAGRPSVDLAEPFLAIAMLTNPEAMAEATQAPALHGRGLLARFLFAVAPPVAGTREINQPPVPDEVAAEWDRTVRAVLDTALAAEAVTTLELTPEAEKVFTTFRADWEPRLNPETGDLAGIPAWASKHAGKVARIASLLALVDDPSRTEVEAEHVQAAVGLAEPLAAHARAALALTVDGGAA